MTTLTGDSFTSGYSWTLANIRSKVRELIMRPSTSQVSNSTLDDNINRYYQDIFPLDVESSVLQSTASVTMTATDSGVYDINDGILKITDIETESGQVIPYTDRSEFYKDYPEDYTGVTSPDGAGLTYGSSDNKKVKNSAFYYTIEGYSYYKASAETTMSGDTVPSGTYGAFSVQIDTSGTITISEAADNATGYTTPRLAIEGLTIEDNDKACMGFIVVSGSYVPGTTALTSASFADGKYSTRGTPIACLHYGNQIISTPKPDDWYQLRCGYIKRPTYLSGDSSTLLDNTWGLTIAYGTAIHYFISKGETQKADKLRPDFEQFKLQINRKKFNQSQKRPLAQF